AAEAAAVVVERPIGPAIAEIEAAEHLVEERRGTARAIVVLGFHQHRRCSSMRLDVVRLESESLEPDEVVQRLPEDAGDGDLGHHPEHDELSAPCLPPSRPRSSRSRPARAETSLKGPFEDASCRSRSLEPSARSGRTAATRVQDGSPSLAPLSAIARVR